LLADLDVEAPNDHVLLGVELENKEPVNIMLPFIDYPACIKCGACAEVCDTGAIILSRDGAPLVVPRLCSGCRSCYFVCPTKAILEGLRTIGYTYRTRVRLDGGEFDLVTGVIREGEEHTPPVVIATKRRALSIKDVDLYLIDTAAGTSNTVSTAIDEARLAVAVTEPTPLGAHDLDMILEVTEEMGVETWVVVNRYGIGPESLVEEVTKKHNARIVAKLPYSKEVVESYVGGRPIVVWRKDTEPAKVLMDLARNVLEVI
jgi:MinD superfamily P-loop ATPase